MSASTNRMKVNEGTQEHPSRNEDSKDRPNQSGVDPQDPRSRRNVPGQDSPRRPEDLPEQEVSGRPAATHADQGERHGGSGTQGQTKPSGSNQEQEGHRDQDSGGQPGHSGGQEKKGAQSGTRQQDQRKQTDKR